MHDSKRIFVPKPFFEITIGEYNTVTKHFDRKEVDKLHPVPKEESTSVFAKLRELYTLTLKESISQTPA